MWVAVLGSNELVAFDPASHDVTATLAVGGQTWDVQAGLSVRFLGRG